MERIDVTVRFESSGRIEPLSFASEGHLYPIESTGRSWKDEQGFHILVMVPVSRVCELVFTPSDLGWYLQQIGPARAMA
jgi:hypothetical protein